VRFAATSVIEGQRRICSGRCSRPQLPALGDPDNAAHLGAPQDYCWARPRNLPDLTEEVRGECCIGKRHFDCVGFVSWCFWKALGNAFPANLATADVGQWKAYWRTTVPRTGPFQVGDLLFDRGEDHIGVVISPTEVAHSAGYRWGVRCALISDNIYGNTGGHWVSARRPTIRV
jgi:cell wall-associated NlpC family hydrolase